MPIIFHTLALGIMLVIAWLYWLGITESYFWLYWWYDIPLHLLGGLVIGLWGCAVAAKRNLNPRQTLILVLMLVIVGGVAWEVFEHIAGLTRDGGYWFDTIKDLFDDLVGALVPLIMYRSLYIKKFIHPHE